MNRIAIIDSESGSYNYGSVRSNNNDHTTMRLFAYRHHLNPSRSDLEVSEPKPTFRQQTCGCLQSTFTANNILTKLISFIPFFSILRKFYTKKLFIFDLIAAFTITTFHIPQGMAYGLLAGLAPVNGLYTSFYPQLVYFFLGTSRHLSVGTFSLISLMTEETVSRLSKPVCYGNETIENSLLLPCIDSSLVAADRVGVAISLTLLTGLIQVIMGFFQLGFLVSYLSDALVSGFTAAAAIHVVASQLTKLFGFSVPSNSGIGKLFLFVVDFFSEISHTNWCTLLISVISMLSLHVVREWINPRFKAKFHFPLPMELILVAVGTLVSYLANLQETYKVAIVGNVPAGLADFRLPSISYFPDILTDAIVMAIVTYGLSASLSKIYAMKGKYTVDYNQELIALGSSNVFSSFFQCHVACGALARTSVAYDVGMASQVASLLSSIFMLLVLLFIGPLFRTVPECVLSSIIIISLKNIIMQVKQLKSLWRESRYDFAIWIVAFLATLILDVSLGLIVGFLFALVTILYRTQSQKSEILGYLPHTEVYMDVTKCTQAVEISKIKIFRYNGSIYFANCEHFRDSLLNMTGAKNRNKITNYNKKNNLLRTTENDLTTDENAIQNILYIIIDCAPWSYIDLAAINTLKQIISTLSSAGTSLLFAHCSLEIREMLFNNNIDLTLSTNSVFFPTIHDAVLEALEQMKKPDDPEVSM